LGWHARAGGVAQGRSASVSSCGFRVAQDDDNSVAGLRDAFERARSPGARVTANPQESRNVSAQ